MENLSIIIGLGNPGDKYTYTKHNMGFLAVDKLALEYGIKIKKLKFKALYGDGKIGSKRVMLVKPQTFMNLSGESVRDIFEWYKLPIENLILIYDDIDLPIGKVRIRARGSAGTHKGMQSVVYLLNSDEFPRIRIGIGSETDKPIEDYVLTGFKPEELKTMAESVDRAAKAAADIVESGVVHAMNKYNGIGKDDENNSD
ncbi:MAG: aminoacyl-tRNA hydrolase [Eubacteriales bacterium]|nr:aminoacyl-tRNA hydrolase [Eubacteriales bacterium]